ncbi:MAG: hypothetical protein IKH28_09915 [Lachnospiraceae bacterium]|nr:hypothetical protein [Lachnospiraceae bacterium]
MDQELKDVLQVINERFDKMEERMEERFDRLENDVTSIKLTIENELRPNIQTLAGVCLDTNRKLDDYIEKNDSRVEQLDLRVSNLEIQKYLKNRNHRRKAGSSE